MKAKVINKSDSLIYRGEIYRFGDEFEVDDTIGKSLIERGLIEGITDNPDLFEKEEVIDLGAKFNEMSYKELQKYAGELGLPANGKREELETRIEEFLDGAEELDAEEDDSEAEELPNTSMPE